MLLTKKVEIKVNNTSINHYKNLGYDVKNKDSIVIPIEHLSMGSHKEVEVKCDICGDIKKMNYKTFIKIDTFNLHVCNKTKCKQEKIKISNLFKYNVEYPAQKKEIFEKNKQTLLERYGVDHPFKLTKKLKVTWLKKYGVDNPKKNKEIDKRISETKNKNIIKKYDLIDKSGSTFTLKCDNNKNHNYDIDTCVYKLRLKYKTICCTKCNPINNLKSGIEIEIQEFIQKNYNNVIFNDRKIIRPYELDVYLPDLKLGFEFNGLFWHSELYRNKNYHYQKTESSEKQGIKLIQIYEDDWLYKKDIIKSRILNLLNKTPNRIYGRKCNIREVDDNNLVRKFLIENHIQGFVGSQMKIGLFYNDELVSLMTFGSKRKFMKQSNNDNVYEMLRFCNKLNTSVIGAADKLFKYFINTYHPVEVISYADRSWSQGELYKKLGFTYVGKTPPNYYYVIDRKKYHRFNYRKDKLVREGYDENLSEHEIMLNRKIYRIYDSGSLKFNKLFSLKIISQSQDGAKKQSIN